MNLTSLSDVKALLSEIGVMPNSKLGQNFLIDRNILDIILKMSGVGVGDRVLEVGPGLGILTEILTQKAAFVTAIEKDRGLYAHLCSRLGSVSNLALIHADAVDVDLSGISFNRFVSNLPYCVASRLLVDMFLMENPPESITVTVQLEVADRLAAKADTSDYGLLSIICQLVYDVADVRTITPGCFWPAPGVHSAVINLARRPGILIDANKRKAVRDIVKTAFSMRRKKLSTIFKSMHMPVTYLVESGISPDLRPEKIAPEQWIELVTSISRNGNCDI